MKASGHHREAVPPPPPAPRQSAWRSRHPGPEPSPWHPEDLAVLPLPEALEPISHEQGSRPLRAHRTARGSGSITLGPQALPTSSWVVLETCASPFPGPSWGPVPLPLSSSQQGWKGMSVMRNLEWPEVGGFGFFIFTWLYQILVVAHGVLTCSTWDLVS